MNYYSDHSRAAEPASFVPSEKLWPVLFGDKVVAWATSQSNSEDITAALNNSPKKLNAEARERLDNQGYGIPYDLKPLYHEEIDTLLEEVQRICRQHHLPHILVFQTQHNGKVPTLTARGELYDGRDTEFMLGLRTAVRAPELLALIHSAEGRVGKS